MRAISITRVSRVSKYIAKTGRVLSQYCRGQPGNTRLIIARTRPVVVRKTQT
jgi:hypothetical protein